MTDLADIRATLRGMLPDLAAKYGVAELGLFGSRVRGDHRPDSDLDVLVSFQPDARVSLFTLVELELALSDRLGLKVDVADRSGLKPLVGRRILAEAVAV